MKKLIPFLLFTISFLLFNQIQAQELSIQTGHSSTILDLKFSPDGKILFSCGIDNKIILWDMIASKQMKIFSGHTGVVNCLAIHPTKNLIASASDDKTVRIWEYPSGKLIKTYDFFEYEVKSVAFQPDGTEIACGSNKIYIINLLTDKYGNLEKTTRKSFNAIAYSPDSKYLVFGGKKIGKTYLYNLNTKQIEKKYRINANKIIFDEDGKTIFIAGNRGKIRRIPLSGSLMKKYNITANHAWNSFFSIILNKDYFVSCNKDNLIYVYERKTGKRTEILKAHQGDVRALAISPEGTFMASAGKDRKIIIWNLDKKIITQTLEGGANRVNSISFSEDGKYMFIAYNDGSFRIWNLAQKGKILHGEAPKNKFSKFYKGNETTTENSFVNINIDKIFIKTNLNKLDKNNDEYLSKKENILMWNINNHGEINILSNNKTSDYKSFMLIDTNKIISISHKATHSQKYSLLNHQRIKQREEVFSTKIQSYTVPTETKKKQKINRFSKGLSFKIKGDIYFKTISQTGKYLLVLINTKDNFQKCEIWDIQSGLQVKEQLFTRKYETAGFSSNAKYVYFVSKEDKIIHLFVRETFEIVSRFTGTEPFTISPDEKLCSFTNNSRELYLYDIENKKHLFKVPSLHQTVISDIQFNQPYNYVATSGYDGLIKFWDITSGELLMSLAAFNQNDFIYVTPDNYYYSTKGSMNYIAFMVKDKLYSFEQFDLKYNRPDIVLSKLAYSSEEEIEAYNRAYTKRITKMGFAEDIFENDFNIPEMKITNQNDLPISTTDNSIKLNLKATDSLYVLDRLNIWVNDVPIHGTQGYDLKDYNKKSYIGHFDIQLSSGRNKIQTSVTNSKGIESLKETFTIICDAPPVKPDLYLICIGVSKYKNPSYDLNYAAKDAQDIADLFGQQTERFQNINTFEILDYEATSDTILNLKNTLLNSKVDDIVMLFFAGHGVLDWEMNYFLATTEIDMNNLEETALKYDNLINLLDSIPARRKVIIIDACHSGEVDEESHGKTNNEDARNIGEATFESELNLSTQSSFELMKLMFADLRKGTGTTIISSAGGAEYAYENEKTQNGIFTYVLKKAINSKNADTNKDGDIMLSELRDYVMARVSKITKGYQNPTSRRENLEFDFIIYE